MPCTGSKAFSLLAKRCQLMAPERIGREQMILLCEEAKDHVLPLEMTDAFMHEDRDVKVFKSPSRRHR